MKTKMKLVQIHHMEEVDENDRAVEVRIMPSLAEGFLERPDVEEIVFNERVLCMGEILAEAADAGLLRDKLIECDYFIIPCLAEGLRWIHDKKLWDFINKNRFFR
jgi:hypothetical protein